ncbi:MAG: hypothetical protein Q9221_007497 [Calogaya cf. arnoldii]
MSQSSRKPTMQVKHPEPFAEPLHANPRERTRVRPMEVLSLGMARTGTACEYQLSRSPVVLFADEPSAMQLALNILGFPCYHGITLITNISDTEMWNSALDAKFFGKGEQFKRDDWDALLGNYGAIADLPAILFAEELLLCYPESNVVLVERDIETWYRSFDEGIISNVWNPVIRSIAKLDTRFVGKLGSTSERWTKGWMEADSKSEMQNNARRKYREHYEMVRRLTPPSRLLNFKLEDGWEPLCAFLGRPIPDIDFPRVNESEALGEKIRLIAVRGIKNTIRAYAMTIFSVIAVSGACWAVGTHFVVRQQQL